MRLRNAFWMSVCTFTIYMLLSFLRFFNVLGSEYDLLIRWVSAISLISLGVFVGVLISGMTKVRKMLIGQFLVAVGFISAPFVVFLSIPLINTLPFTAVIKGLILWALTSGYLGGYMAFLFWLKRKGIFKVEEIDSTETET
nr:hypothetical protein [Candidatus Njordarchaeota archaeon]